MAPWNKNRKLFLSILRPRYVVVKVVCSILDVYLDPEADPGSKVWEFSEIRIRESSVKGRQNSNLR